jgi:pantoate--beta-alanine ligase
MTKDLMFDIEVLVLPTVRDEDGVALSSRNVYLSDEERIAARAIPRAIQAAERRVADGEWDAEGILQVAREILEAEPLLKIDYLSLVDAGNLGAVDEVTADAFLLLAAHVGKTRLIDNTILRR